MNDPEPLGTCICGEPSWLTNDTGTAMHPCCEDNGPNCEPCRISRSWRKRQER